MRMKLKYIFIFPPLFVLTACGAKSRQEQQTVTADTTDLIRQWSYTASDGKMTASDTLPTYVDRYSKADSMLVCRILRETVPLRRRLSHGQLILKVARIFVGTPYVAHTLDRNTDEKLVVNLHGLDCTTFIETVTALVLCIERDEIRFSDFVHQLEQIRYRGGKTGYLSRLHYFHWWLEDNVRMGFIAEINTPVPPFTAVQTLKINYMTLNVPAYDMLKNSPERVAGLKKLEDASNGTRIRYIPKSQLGNSGLLKTVVRDGDIIAIVTSKRELDTTHLGFAVWHRDGLHLLNASSLEQNGRQVIEPVETFYHYMMSHPSSIGIRIARIR